MIDLLVGKAIDAAQKGLTYLAGKRHADKERERLAVEEEQEWQNVDDLRRSSYVPGAGNCLTAEIGSEKDRLYGRMAAKGLLVRTFSGYVLPENGGVGGRSARFNSRFH
jgi:histidinol-phosphate/aromatic aminotransferase/cobyric acid decarboxylase-like protein